MTTLRKTKNKKNIHQVEKTTTVFFFDIKGKILIKILLGIVITITFFLIWEALINHYDIPKRILPKPSDLLNFIQKEFFTTHSNRYQTILVKSLFSFKDALIGFFLALILGTLLGIILSENKVIYSILFPFLFFTQLVPIPALAPIIAAILGYGFVTKIVIIVLFTMFSVSIAVKNTIQNLPTNYIELLRTYTYKKIIVLKYLILPSLVPTLLSTMKILCTASIVASIITELPLSVKQGIGKDIYNSFSNQMIPRVWVSVILISLISLIFFNLVCLLEKYINKKYKYGEY